MKTEVYVEVHELMYGGKLTDGARIIKMPLDIVESLLNNFILSYRITEHLFIITHIYRTYTTVCEEIITDFVLDDNVHMCKFDDLDIDTFEWYGWDLHNCVNIELKNNLALTKQSTTILSYERYMELCAKEKELETLLSKNKFYK